MRAFISARNGGVKFSQRERLREGRVLKATGGRVHPQQSIRLFSGHQDEEMRFFRREEKKAEKGREIPTIHRVFHGLGRGAEVRVQALRGTDRKRGPVPGEFDLKEQQPYDSPTPLGKKKG